MNLNQIAKELEKQVKLWEKILNHKTKPKDKGQLESAVHPAKCIIELLDRAYHHPEFPREIDKRCDELYEEVTKAIPIWPSLEWRDVRKVSIIEHVRGYAQMLRKAIRPERLITLTVAVKNFNVSKPTLQRAIKDGRLTTYSQAENAPKNAPLLIDPVKVASLWPTRN